MQIKDVNPDLVVSEQAVKSESAPAEIKEVMDEALAKSSAADEEGDKETVKTPEDGEMPWHKDKRFKNDLHLLKAAKNLMEANGLEDLESLVELVDRGKKVHGKNVDLDKLDDVIEKAKRLEKYEEYWAQQKEMQKRQEEEPDQTIQRLEKQLRDLEHRERLKSEQDRQAKEAKQAVEFYERTVSEFVEDIEDIPKEHHQFISLILGVQNPTNDIDITDRRQIKKATTEILKSLRAFADAMKKQGAEEYRKGKMEIPKVAPSTSGAAPIPEKKIMLKDARKALVEKFMGALSG